MNYDFQADIGANIRDFQREMREVDEIIRETALGAEAMIGADTSEFMREAATVESVVQAIATGDNDVEIGADIAEAMTEIAIVEAATEALERDRIIVRIQARWNNYQAVMGSIANFSRSLGEVMGMTARGIMISLSPAIIPLLGALTLLIGNLGPMLGTIGGSTFALASAFGLAGIGAAGFAAVAIPSITGVIDRAGELVDLQDKMDKATSAKQYNKYLLEMQSIYEGMTKPQIEANKALREFKENYSNLVSSMESPVLEVFASALTGITRMLELARPMIANVTDAVGYLMDAFNRNLESPDVKEFFTFLAKEAAPALLIISKSVGNFMMGLFNLMAAFSPLTKETQTSFLSMSESFRNWTASLGENEKFQQFISYVSENMPKIRSIFGDAIKGIINLFSQFAPSSADMMTSLQDMMERFKEWSAALSENQGFQNFMDYIKESGPKAVELIGNIKDVLVEITQALAPAGSAILDVANKVLDFTAKLLDNHPWLGKVLAAVIVLGGAFLAILPNLVLLNALFGGLITKLIAVTAKTIWAAAVQVAKWIWMGTMATLNAIKIAASWTLATGIAMVTAVAKMTATAALFVAKWLLIGVKAVFHATVAATAWAISTGVAMVVALAKMAASAAVFVAKWTLIGAQALLHAAKVAAAWALSTGAAMAKSLASMIATSAVFVAKWVWMGVQALAQAARMAAAWFIALGPVGWVIGAIVGLAVLIIANWDKISAWTKKTWSTVSEWIKTKWQEISSKTSEAAAKMWSTVKDKFTAIVNSVKEKMANAKSTIQQKWEEAKGAAIGKLTEIVAAVVKFFTQTVTKTREKLSEAVKVVGEKIGEMPGKVLSFVGDMLSAGGNLVRGLIDGIKGMGSAAIESIAGVVGGVISKAKSLLNINSPSRVFSEFGGYISEGLAVGVDAKSQAAVKAVANVANAMTDAFRPQLSAAGVNVSRSSMDVSSQMDQLSAQVKRELSVDMTVNHSRSVDGGGTNGGNNYYITVDAKNVREFNDVVRLFDKQKLRQQ